MNVYLIGVGSQISKIRDILGLSQQTLSEKMGVSRTVISNIEKDPTNMTKSVLMSLYVVSFGEVETKRNDIENLDFNLWEKKEKRHKLLENLIKAGINKKVIATTLGIGSIVIPGMAYGGLFGKLSLPAALIGGAIELFSNPGNAYEESKIEKQDIKNLVFESINLIEKELCICFNLEKPNLVSLINNIEKGNPVL